MPSPELERAPCVERNRKARGLQLGRKEQREAEGQASPTLGPPGPGEEFGFHSTGGSRLLMATVCVIYFMYTFRCTYVCACIHTHMIYMCI